MPDDADLDRELADIMGPFYDRQGNEITFIEFTVLKFETPGYIHIGLDTAGDHAISTVWLGQPHGKDWTTGQPLLFETLVTGPDGSHVFARYPTEAEADDGHRQIVAHYTSKRTGQQDHPPV